MGSREMHRGVEGSQRDIRIKERGIELGGADI